jgi:hypothetical protein
MTSRVVAFTVRVHVGSGSLVSATISAQSGAPNAASPLGTNLSLMRAYSSEYTFNVA